MSIRREIEVTRKGLPNPIDVTYGTNILPIEFIITDFKLPSATTATASCEDTSKKSRTQSCDVSGNMISFTPKAGFFKEGKNILQLNISTDEGVLYTFAQPVNCHYTIGVSSEYDGEDKPGTPSGGTGSGVTAAQANTLLTIMQKVAFTEQLTNEELENFKKTWGISGTVTDDENNGNTDGGDNTDPDQGEDDETGRNDIELVEVTSCVVASWLSGVANTPQIVESAEDVEVIDGVVTLKAPVYESTFYTKSRADENHYESLKGKYVVSFAGDIYYIAPEATHNHATFATGMTSENISYSPAYKANVKE